LHTTAKLQVKDSKKLEIIMENLLTSMNGDSNPREQGGLTPLDIAIDADNGTAAAVLLKYNAIAPR
jgi:hypothetical protein